MKEESSLDSGVVPPRAGAIHAVEWSTGEGGWSRREFSQIEAAHEFLRGAVSQAAQPIRGAWMAGAVVFRLREGQRTVVEIAIEVTYSGEAA